MMAFMGRFLLTFLIVTVGYFSMHAQGLKNIELNESGKISVFTGENDTEVGADESLPLFSFKLNETQLSSRDAKRFIADEGYEFHYSDVSVTVTADEEYQTGWKGTIRLKNTSQDTVSISNVVPFGTASDHVYITGKGDHHLSRTHLFRPGFDPVNVIVPDNAWELGFSALPMQNNQGVTGLVRRDTSINADNKRFETVLAPEGSVAYNFYADFYQGDWQEALRLIFQDRYLYDVEVGEFDNTLYEREDLTWVRHAYASHLIMAWDKDFYNRDKGEYTLKSFLKRGQKWYGGDDFVGIWPTWPTLGLDQRNQWDLFRDLPGGLDKLGELAVMSRDMGTKFFISYNPWDESTRFEDHYEGMAQLIDDIGVDGVVLDTEGSSNEELQSSADSVRDGVIMYSEGMAVPKDMQGIVSGRVHNALYYPPMLNLNKFIKPEFAIFRVAELAFERIRREYAVSFFNGYGTELNIFRAGRPNWIEEDYRFWGRTLRILRQNTTNFTAKGYTPLLPTLKDEIFVNKWPTDDKVVYTIFSTRPAGFKGDLFEVTPKEGYHFVDLWKHEELSLPEKDGSIYMPVDVSGFHKKWLGTNNEGAVSAIAQLPKVLNTELKGDTLSISASQGDSVLVWAGSPEYEKQPLVLAPGDHQISIFENFGRFEGKLIVKLMKDGELLDLRTEKIVPGKPRLVSKVHRTARAAQAPKGMVHIPGGEFTMEVTQGDQFVPYPTDGYPKEVSLSDFYMDKHPVTNAEFKAFLDATGYQPENDKNFLKHWENGQIPDGKEQYPVVYVTYEDAKAYANWAGKRLPTEEEWQYAASAGDGRAWPWDKDLEVTKRKEFITNTLTVEHIEGIDSTYANLGNNKMDPVGSYPKGANPFGLEDLVGSVWQLTNDLYNNATFEFVMMKGGSYYKPSASWWYVQGGPRETHYRQMLLRVSPGFERNRTVGFRLVKDAKQ